MRSYRNFLGFSGDTIIEVMRCMENEEWHHKAGGELYEAYLGLSSLLYEVIERAKFYVNTKGLTGEERHSIEQLAAATDGLDRLTARFVDSSQRPEYNKPKFNDNVRGETRLDSGKDDPEVVGGVHSVKP